METTLITSLTFLIILGIIISIYKRLNKTDRKLDETDRKLDKIEEKIKKPSKLDDFIREVNENADEYRSEEPSAEEVLEKNLSVYAIYNPITGCAAYKVTKNISNDEQK